MAYTNKGLPFVYRGVQNVMDCKTSEEVMQKAKLDWTVAKCPLVAQMPIFGSNFDEDDEGFLHGTSFYRECPEAYATYRTDKNIPLGIVKGKYTPVQNIDAFNFFDDAIGKNCAKWETAGCFGNGERIFVSAKLPQTTFIGGGDPVENYLVFTTSHDGSTGVKILFTPIRVICQNTLNAAIKTSQNYISFKHTKSVHSNIDIAAQIMNECNLKVNFLSESFNQMFKIKMNDEDAMKKMSHVILSENELVALHTTGHNTKEIIYRNYQAIEDSGISMKKVNTLSQMWDYYHTGAGQKEIMGTGWGVYNAVTGYYSNVDNAEGSKRMDSLLFGDKARKIEHAGNIILAA